MHEARTESTSARGALKALVDRLVIVATLTLPLLLAACQPGNIGGGY